MVEKPHTDACNLIQYNAMDADALDLALKGCEPPHVDVCVVNVLLSDPQNISTKSTELNYPSNILCLMSEMGLWSTLTLGSPSVG